MGGDCCFLITILQTDELLQCALKVDRDKVGSDVYEYPMEPESRAVLHKMLPLHVQNCGPIVAVKNIFDIHDAA